MSRRSPSHRVVQTVALPSGKTLEVVHPTGGEPSIRVQEPAKAPDRDLSICTECSSNLVEPTDWSAAGEGLWRVALHCPNCLHNSDGVYTQECVDLFDERLDEATTVMVTDLRRLEAANMADEVETFISALNADAILPEDFGTEGGSR